MMTKTNLFSWPGFNDFVRDEMKGFMFSFELIATTLIVFIPIMKQLFAGQLKCQNLRFFLQFIVAHILKWGS